MTRDEAVQCLADVADVALANLTDGLADGTYEDDDIGGWSSDQIEEAMKAVNAPPPRVQIVANISGGVLQGASSNYPAEIYTLDFDTDSFDEKAVGILVEDNMAYLGQQSANLDPDFVKSVIEAPERFIHNEALVCGQCEGTGETQSMSNLELEICPVCDGTGERPDAE